MRCLQRCCPRKSLSTMCNFNSLRQRPASPNAVVAKGQTIDLPAGHYNRVYVLAASAEGDQKATFEVGGTGVDLNIEDWGGFIGQWDDRQWSSKRHFQ